MFSLGREYNPGFKQERGGRDRGTFEYDPNIVCEVSGDEDGMIAPSNTARVAMAQDDVPYESAQQLRAQQAQEQQRRALKFALCLCHPVSSFPSSTSPQYMLLSAVLSLFFVRLSA